MIQEILISFIFHMWLSKSVILDLVTALLNKKLLQTPKANRWLWFQVHINSNSSGSQCGEYRNDFAKTCAKINGAFCVSVQISTKCEQCSGKKLVWFIDDIIHLNLPAFHKLSKVLLFWQRGQSSVPVPEEFSTQDKEAFLLVLQSFSLH